MKQKNKSVKATKGKKTKRNKNTKKSSPRIQIAIYYTYICKHIHFKHRIMTKSSFLKDFKAFALKGNVVDMAVGVVIGGAFGKIVSSLVSDIIMPAVGMLTGGVKFTDLKFVLRPAVIKDGVEEVAAVTINYGNFIQVGVDFLIISLTIFLVIKGMAKMKRKKEEAPKPAPAPAKPSKEEILLSEIRDILKNK